MQNAVDDEVNPPYLLAYTIAGKRISRICYPERYTTLSGPMPTLYPQAPDMAASDPRLDYSPMRRHIPCIHFRQRGGCKDGDACAFAHDPFLTMPQEYVDSQTKLYSHPPELIAKQTQT